MMMNLLSDFHLEILLLEVMSDVQFSTSMDFKFTCFASYKRSPLPFPVLLLISQFCMQNVLSESETFIGHLLLLRITFIL